MTAAGPLTSIASFPSGMHITKPALSFRIANARTRSLTSRSDVVPRELCVVPVSPNAAMLEGMVGNAQLVDGDGDGDGDDVYVGDGVADADDGHTVAGTSSTIGICSREGNVPTVASVNIPAAIVITIARLSD